MFQVFLQKHSSQVIVRKMGTLPSLNAHGPAQMTVVIRLHTQYI